MGKYYWILFSLLSVLATIFTFSFFSVAFPFIDLDVASRNQIIDSSKILQDAFQLESSNQLVSQKLSQIPNRLETQIACQFNQDSSTQHFVELTSGSEQFSELLKLSSKQNHSFYRLFYWDVRHFVPNEILELDTYWSEGAKPIGFSLHLPDTLKTNRSDNQENETLAREIAEFAANSSPWFVKLRENDENSEFELISSSKVEKTASGRVDWEFTYQHKFLRLGKHQNLAEIRRNDKNTDTRNETTLAHFQLKLRVSEGQLVSLIHFVKVPDSFSKTYQEMRSQNELIAFIASTTMFVLFVGSGIFSFIFLWRKKDGLRIKHNAILSLCLSVLMGSMIANKFPLSWFSYRTESDPSVFVSKFVLQVLINTVLVFAITTPLFSTSEGVTRISMKHTSTKFMWRDLLPFESVLIGYLAVPLMFAYEVLFYMIALKGENKWWIPSGTLVNPNILGHYFPFLSSVAMSLQAGVLEECMFRVFPLGCCVWLLQSRPRVSKFTRYSVLTFAFILQALVFSAAHANYPNQPSYARLVELLIPSFLFGFLYLFVGLSSAITLHFLYDLVWMCLPVFMASDLWFDRLIVLIVGILPLFISIIFDRLAPVPDTSVQKTIEKNENNERKTENKKVNGFIFVFVNFIGIISLLFWMFAPSFFPQFNNINDRFLAHGSVVTTKQTATKTAIDYLEITKQISLENYTVSTVMDRSYTKAHQFVWEKIKEQNENEIEGNNNNENIENFQTIINSFQSNPFVASLENGPQYVVSFLKFSGSLEEKNEAWLIFVSATLTEGVIITRVSHQLPQWKVGSNLTRNEAILKAQQHFIQSFENNKNKHEQTTNINENDFYVVGATSEKQSSGRVDWSIKFKLNETANEILAYRFWPQFIRKNTTTNGDHRILLRLIGDEVTEQTGFVDIPQDWLRKYSREKEIPKLIENILGLLVKAILVILTVNSLLKWHLSFRLFFSISIFFFLEFISMYFGWESVQAGFDPNVPYLQQAAQSITARVFSVVVEFIFIFANYSHVTSAYPFRRFDISQISLGISVGIILNVSWLFFKTSNTFMKQTNLISPLWVSTLDLIVLESDFPLFSGSLIALRGFASYLVSILVVVHLFDRMSNFFTKRLFLTTFFSFFVSFISFSSIFGFAIEFLDEWLFASLIFSCLLCFFYVFVFRDNAHLIPISVASYFVLTKLRRAFFLKQVTYVSFQFDLICAISIAIFALIFCKFWLKVENNKKKED